MGDVTALLHRVRHGDQDALNVLLPLVYSELHRLAESRLRNERAGHTLQPTSLVHEAYLRVFGGNPAEFQDRAHFLGIVARVMRQVLVDHARSRNASKRGAGLMCEIQTGEIDGASSRAPAYADVIAIDEALERLGQQDPRLVRWIEMRFYAGMTAEETAEVDGESVHVVRHNLRYAQAWLRKELAS